MGGHTDRGGRDFYESNITGIFAGRTGVRVDPAVVRYGECYVVVAGENQAGAGVAVEEGVEGTDVFGGRYVDGFGQAGEIGGDGLEALVGDDDGGAAGVLGERSVEPCEVGRVDAGVAGGCGGPAEVADALGVGPLGVECNEVDAIELGEVRGESEAGVRGQDGFPQGNVIDFGGAGEVVISEAQIDGAGEIVEDREEAGDFGIGGVVGHVAAEKEDIDAIVDDEVAESMGDCSVAADVVGLEVEVAGGRFEVEIRDKRQLHPRLLIACTGREMRGGHDT